ncbi:MAG: SMC-Scp complex subunit ScpB [Bauldia sp.]
MRDQSVVQLFPLREARAPLEDDLRIVEALLFAAAEPVSEDELRLRLPAEVDVAAIVAELQAFYAPRGVNLVRVAGKWTMRTAPDLAHLMTREQVEQRKLSRAALETLAIIAYHQPITRAEIEEMRGVSLGKGTLDMLMEVGWVRLRGRRETPGRPVTFGTTELFLEHFGLDKVNDLPGIEELIGTGLIDRNALSTPTSEDADALPELPEDEAELDLSAIGDDMEDDRDP